MNNSSIRVVVFFSCIGYGIFASATMYGISPDFFLNTLHLWLNPSPWLTVIALGLCFGALNACSLPVFIDDNATLRRKFRIVHIATLILLLPVAAGLVDASVNRRFVMSDTSAEHLRGFDDFVTQITKFFFVQGFIEMTALASFVLVLFALYIRAVKRRDFRV